MNQRLYVCLQLIHKRENLVTSCVIVHEGWPYGGVGAEIADRVQRLAFDDLDAPVLRVTQLDVPMPYNAKLEQLVMPQPDRVIAAVKTTMRRG